MKRLVLFTPPADVGTLRTMRSSIFGWSLCDDSIQPTDPAPAGRGIHDRGLPLREGFRRWPFFPALRGILHGQIWSARCLLTTSCTDALELAALLCRIKPGDEVILPSFTFVSTANAFALRGAKLVFADSLPDHPNMDPAQVEALVTPRTRVIVPVHYAGVAMDMDPILALAEHHNLFVVEDAAQAVEAKYRGRQLGTLGNFGAFSFHETKNVHCGEGGLLAVNDQAFTARAEILREKGTNRAHSSGVKWISTDG